MFVSENFECNPGDVKVRISATDGTSAWLAVDAELTCDALKINAVAQLFDCADSCKMSLYYSLLHVSSGRTLGDEQTLRQASVADNDELLLIRRRLLPAAVPAPKKDTGAPSTEDIAKATEHLRVLNVERTRPDQVADVDFQTELRKILVSLIDVAQKLVCLNSGNNFREAKKYTFGEKTSQFPKPPSVPAVDDRALQQLVEMGFDRTKATKALLINKMSHVRAIQWLCDNMEDETTDASEQQAVDSCPSPDPSAACASISSISESEHPQSPEDISSDSEQKLTAELFELAKLSGAPKVQRMLDAFKSYKRRVFTPDSAELRSLLEMGFDECQAVDALRIHNNSKDEACEWLLNRSSASAACPADNDAVGEGLDPTSSLYRAILSNHVIQLSLTNHKTLTALLHILENPDSRQQWLCDADLNPMLVQISRIYHAEKYGR